MIAKQTTDISVLDIAAYIINYLGEIPKAKMWRLVFLCQAWYMVKNNGTPLFKEQIEAWVNGPMVPELYNAIGTCIHDTTIWRIPGGNPSILDLKSKMFICEVLDIYGRKSTADLIMSTYTILPWRLARQNYGPMEACTDIIPNDVIYEYYKCKSIDQLV